MAYVSKEDKANLTPGIKAVLKKYGLKGTIAVRDHSTLVVTIREGDLDFVGARNKALIADWRNDFSDKATVDRINYRLTETSIDVNEYYIEDCFGKGRETACLEELKVAMKGPKYFNHTDSQTDYFHRSHYLSIKIGAWNKPYVYTGKVPALTFEPVKLREAVS